MINGDVDELRVSGEVFAATLRAAGRPVEVVVESGTTHGHLNRPDEPAFARSLSRITHALTSLPLPPPTPPVHLSPGAGA